MKKVLITGKNSYIGTSLENCLMRESSNFLVKVLDMHGRKWEAVNFADYDTVFHVAGIAHTSSDPKMESLYYEINRDLTIKTAEKAKKEGVKQFIFMSSILVYGDVRRKDGLITKNTQPLPVNFYGKSKLQAEEGIKRLESESFKVLILRPPMIYGKDSKGNYPRLAKFAKRTPIFPNIKNERSMLYIGNLCEFIKQVILKEEGGMFFPQNKEYVNTSKLVQEIAEVQGKKIKLTTAFNFLIKGAFWIKAIKKVFGNLIYDKSMSRYPGINYQIYSFQESIKRTEE